MMRSGNALVLLLVIRGSALADPAQAPPRPRECKPAGGLLFEVDQRADRKAKLTTATTRLFENGAWKTEVIDVDGKLARTQVGCRETSQLDNIRTELRTATWKVSHADIACRSDSPRFTTYTWKGRTLYTERTCNRDVLDENSQHALDLIEVYLKLPVDLDDAGLPGRPTSLPSVCIQNPLLAGCQ